MSLVIRNESSHSGSHSGIRHSLIRYVCLLTKRLLLIANGDDYSLRMKTRLLIANDNESLR